MDNDWQLEDSDADTNPELFSINTRLDPVGGFRFHATMDSEEEEEEEMEIPQPVNQAIYEENEVSPFDYLTNLIQREETDSFHNYSNTSQTKLPENGIHKACIIPLHVPSLSTFHIGNHSTTR